MTSIKRKLITLITLPSICLAIAITVFNIYTSRKFLIEKTFEDLLHKSEMEVYRLEKTLNKIETTVTLFSDFTELEFNPDEQSER